MAHEYTVSFKVFLLKTGSDDKPEVRRFGVDRDVVSSFPYLKEKLQTVFPALRSKDFIVSWKDDEGDDIIISSDDELMIALTEMQTDVRKLYVTVKDNSQQASSASSGSAFHAGITCDGCEKGVKGFRYICLQCPDYDLCAGCEGKGVHSEHFMIRSPVPISLRPHFGRRLAHQLSKSSRRASGSGECPWRDKKHGTGHFPLLEMLGTYLNTFVNPAPEEQESQAKNQNKASTSQNQNTNPEAKKERGEDRHIDYLMNVGKTVAEMLDPLGIDVEVSVSNNKTKKTTKADEGKFSHNDDDSACEKSSDRKEVSRSEPTDNKKSEVQEVKNDGEKAEAPASTPSQSDRESPENDGWTVLNKEIQQNQIGEVKEADISAPANSDGTVAASVTQTAPTVSESGISANSVAASVAHSAAASVAAHAAAAAMARAATGAIPKQQVPIYYPPPPPFGVQQGSGWPLYPQLPQGYSVPAPLPVIQTAALPQPLHRDPKIADAVQKMMAMGFSNEGGWLTQLLEFKNGDIVKALDVLQPVKK